MKKHLRRGVSLLLSLALIGAFFTSSFAASAAGLPSGTTFTQNNITYKVTGPSAVMVNNVADATLIAGDVDLSWGVTLGTDHYDVTSVGANAFRGCAALGAVTLPSTVTSIGVAAFYGSGVTSVNIPDAVTSLGDHAFDSCKSLTDVNISVSSKLAAVGNNVFTNCTALTAIYLPDTVTSFGTNMFTNDAALQNVRLPKNITAITTQTFYACAALQYVNCSPLTAVGDQAFFGCAKLTNISLDPSLTAIGAQAFRNSGLTGIDIPAGVTAIGDNAFDNCQSLASVIFEPNYQLTSIGSYAFYSDAALTSIDIPFSVTAIGDHAFTHCVNLSAVTLPSDLTAIPDYAFYDTALTSVHIPYKVTAIGDYSFALCHQLSCMELPTGFDGAGIGPNAFTQCPAAYIYYTQVSVTSVNMMYFTDLTVGDSYRLAATISPSNATDQRLVWASGNPAVAAVDQGGNVTGLASGMADIYAYAADGSGKYEYCTFDVSAPLATGLSIVPETVDLYPGGTAQLSVAMTPSNASADVTWSSADDDFVSVDQNGLVTAKQNADIYVYARTTDGSNLMAICVVHVHPPAVDFKIQNINGYAGETITVPITYNNHGNLIGDGSVTVKYDSANLLYEGYSSDISGLYDNAPDDQDGTGTVGLLPVAFFLNDGQFISDSGTLATLTFKVTGDSGVYPVNLEVGGWDAYDGTDDTSITNFENFTGAIQVNGYAGQTASMTNTAAPSAKVLYHWCTSDVRIAMQMIVGKFKTNPSNNPNNLTTDDVTKILKAVVGKLPYSAVPWDKADYLETQNIPNSYLYGNHPVNDVGCGVVATYNALIGLGNSKTQDFSNVLKWYNSYPPSSVASLVLQLLAGFVQPQDIVTFFKNQGYNASWKVSLSKDDVNSIVSSHHVSIVGYEYHKENEASLLGVNLWVPDLSTACAHYVAVINDGKNIIAHEANGYQKDKNPYAVNHFDKFFDPSTPANGQRYGNSPLCIITID